MKKTYKAVALMLSFIMVLSGFSITVYAEEKTGSFNFLSFNVAGLPDVSSLKDGITAQSIASLIDNKTINNQRVIGKFVEEKGYDIFATQEDFFYHDYLQGELSSYRNFTAWQGGIPWGDGTTVFTKSFNLTGEKHIKWNSLSGDGSQQDGADEYSRKGITYVCVEIDEGVYIDLYDIHADAYGDEGSVKARKDNFKQLCDLIDERNTGRAVIITGDFNISAHHVYDESGQYFLQRFIVEEGFKDAWTEIYNDGNYTDYSKFKDVKESYWGVWDSVEKFLYRSGDDVDLTADSFSYINDITDDEGNKVSDHAAVECLFSYTASGSGVSEKPSKTESQRDSFFRKVFSFVISLLKGLFNIKAIADFQGF